MRVEVKVPQLPESVAEATLVNWHKKVGEAVRRDENLIDIETDKVVLEMPAPQDGVLIDVLKDDGSTVVGQEVIAVIDTDAKASTGAQPSGDTKGAASPAKPAAPAAASAPGAAPTALPAARKMMAEQRIDAVTIEGTGRGGRITKGD